MNDGGHRARKRFGQHFLHDAGVIRRILASLDPRAGERIVEIGPGLGALTWPLLERVEHLQAVELDRDVIARLRADPAPANACRSTAPMRCASISPRWRPTASRCG
jgi:dimethyladenosine transferase (EC 2.1.1.-)